MSAYKYDLFVSYASDDRPEVMKLVESLKESGLSIFWDQDLSGGDEFPPQLRDALDLSRHFLLFCTAATAEAHPWVQREWHHFLRHADADPARKMFVRRSSVAAKDVPSYAKDAQAATSDSELRGQILRAFKTDLADQRRKLSDARDFYKQSRFWNPIARSRELHIFTCGRELPQSSNPSRGSGGRTAIDMWDYRAVMCITRYFASEHPGTVIHIEDPISKLNERDLDDATKIGNSLSTCRDLLADKNCIIIGSPDVSDLAETSLAGIHRIHAYQKERVKTRGFVIVKATQATRSSFYWAKKNNGEEEGVAEIRSPTKTVSYPYREIEGEHKEGKMYGILVVANNPFNKSTKSKILILSGFSGVATYGIAQLLTENVCMNEFNKLDDAYGDLTQDIEILVGIRFTCGNSDQERDTRRIIKNGITFEGFVPLPREPA